MPTRKPIAGTDALRPLKTEWDEYRYNPTPRRAERAAPSVGIFDSPTRCLLVNKEWWSHVSGMIDVLSSPDMWAGDKEEKTRAITEIALLLSIESCGDMATKEDIRDGMYEAFNRLALQVATGQYANIGLSTDEDGTVTPTPEGAGDVEIPEDDPLTDIDESAAATYGGTVAMVKAIRLFLDKIDNYYGPVNGAPITSAADTKQFINAYFATDETAMNAAIDGYFAYRATNARFVFQDTSAVTLYFFCHGNDEAAWGQWLVDLSAYPATKQAMMKMLTDALLDSFWTDYFATGVSKPNFNYLDAACVPGPPETILVPVMVTGVNGSNIWKTNHRLKITSSGHWTDVAGDIKDSWWYRSAAGVNTFQGASYTLQIGGTGVVKPSSNVVPYKTSHVYVYTIDTPNAGVLGITIPSTSMDSPVTGTGLTLQIEDLGEISV